MSTNGTRRPRVAIVGAGVSGIAAARTLDRAGIPFTVFEKAGDVGGTWRDHTYPGLSCDIPMLAYCYSFSSGNGEWDRLLAPGSEIQRQLCGVVDANRLRSRMRFNSEIVDCRWDRGHWTLRTAHGEEHAFEAVVHATGWLHQPRRPDISGLENFQGPVLHTARWDDSVDLDGKRIGIIGTGSSGVQILTAVAERAQHVTSFQRTPQWILPLNDAPLHPRLLAMLRRVPGFASFARESFWWFAGSFSGPAAIRDGWQRRVLTNVVRKNLATVQDPELRARLTPPYPPGCKRGVMSGNYYEVVQRPNVSVVVGAVDRVEPTGVVGGDGELVELDVLVLATGYNTHAYMRPMNVVGEDGLTLDELWRDGVFSYRTTGLPGFPNLFMIMGPYVSTNHIGVQEAAEAQAAYIVRALERLGDPSTISITPTREATDAWMAEVRNGLEGSIWTHCSSYWVDEVSRLPVQWPWSRKAFFTMLKAVNWGEYRIQNVRDTKLLGVS
jgi:cation diffusion facilitator CzcD-associated flavoprotein CzcO